MNALQKFISSILTFFLTLLILTLIICLNLKDVVTNSISDSVVKETLTNKITTVVINNMDNIDDEDVSSIKEIISSNKDLENISSTYIEQTLNYLSGTTNLNNIDVKSDISDIVKNNKSLIEEKTNKTITDEEIDNILTDIDDRVDINNIYKEQASKLKNRLSEEQLSVIKLYNIMTQQSTKTLLIILIIINIILIALVKLSLYKWIINIGTSLSISGGIIVLLSGIVSNLATSATKQLSMNIDVSRNNLFNDGLYLLVIGIVIIIIYKVLIKIFTKKELINDIH